MQNTTALVIDVGTSSMRGVVFAGGKKVFVARRAYQPEYGANGVVEQDASTFLSALAACCGETAAYAREHGLAIDFVSLTSQRSSITAVDDDARPLMPFIMWQDTRNAALVADLARSGDRVFELSGTRVNTVFSGAKMAWVERSLPDVAAAAARYVTIPELLIHELCGTWACDQTYASRSNLMNIRARDWDPELLGLFGVPARKLSCVVEPGSVVGNVTPAFSAATGLAAGTPVVSAGGDQQCGALGQGIVSPGTVSIVAGTGAFLETLVDEVPAGLTDSVVCNASALAGRYTLEASVPACCSAFDWYRRTFCPDMHFDAIASAVAAEHERCAPTVVLPHFQGRGTPDWNPGARGVFAGLDLSATRESLLYSLLVGIFTEVRTGLDSFEDYVAIRCGSISGGLTQTPVINQVQADVYGIELARLADAESTARGALISALVGQGVCEIAEEAFAQVTDGIVVEGYVPDASKHARLAAVKDEAQRIYGG